VRTFTGDNLKPSSTLKLGGDADNIRVDPKTSTLLVGYGAGAIAVIDARTLRKIREVPLDGHPESFQIASTSNRIYVNVPDARQIVIADRASGHVVEKVAAQGPRANFPLALDDDARKTADGISRSSTAADADFGRDATRRGQRLSRRR
jgi:hypothetical protein